MMEEQIKVVRTASAAALTAAEAAHRQELSGKMEELGEVQGLLREAKAKIIGPVFQTHGVAESRVIGGKSPERIVAFRRCRLLLFGGLLSFSLQLFQFTLADTTKFDEQVTGSGGLTTIDVTANHDGQVFLTFSHLEMVLQQ